MSVTPSLQTKKAVAFCNVVFSDGRRQQDLVRIHAQILRQIGLAVGDAALAQKRFVSVIDRELQKASAVQSEYAAVTDVAYPQFIAAPKQRCQRGAHLVGIQALSLFKYAAVHFFAEPCEIRRNGVGVGSLAAQNAAAAAAAS